MKFITKRPTLPRGSAAEGGTQITANDTVKTGITKLYAQWAVYVDPFVDAICEADEEKLGCRRR